MIQAPAIISEGLSAVPAMVSFSGKLAGSRVREAESSRDIKDFISRLKRMLPNPVRVFRLTADKHIHLLQKPQPSGHRSTEPLLISPPVVRKMSELIALSFKHQLDLSSPQGVLGKIVQGLSPLCDEGIEMFSVPARLMLEMEVGGYSILSLGSDSDQYAAFDAWASPELRQALCEKIKLLIREGALLIGARQYARFDTSPGLRNARAMTPTVTKFAGCDKPSAIQAQAPVSHRVAASNPAPRPAGIYLDDRSKRSGLYLDVLFQPGDMALASFFDQRDRFV